MTVMALSIGPGRCTSTVRFKNGCTESTRPAFALRTDEAADIGYASCGRGRVSPRRRCFRGLFSIPSDPTNGYSFPPARRAPAAWERIRSGSTNVEPCLVLANNPRPPRGVRGALPPPAHTLAIEYDASQEHAARGPSPRSRHLSYCRRARSPPDHSHRVVRVSQAEDEHGERASTVVGTDGRLQNPSRRPTAGVVPSSAAAPSNLTFRSFRGARVHSGVASTTARRTSSPGNCCPPWAAFSLPSAGLYPEDVGYRRRPVCERCSLHRHYVVIRPCSR
ncbi:hypothetical protein PYCCODRAFT_1216997 [Trametes coccinea BRFM310]|uniref:Uncharacterized protein n=1 Tax=Trametes coccinea (strain BRFM310) TaxID=1353009 RepID=A0A1Y2I6S4_TRAC3|nr:hypothetical protein PYCCODRAFT_1216997 [Trametes coccinea BRFM310]